MAHSGDKVRSVGGGQRREKQRSAAINQGTPPEVGATNVSAFAAYQSNGGKWEPWRPKVFILSSSGGSEFGRCALSQPWPCEMWR